MPRTRGLAGDDEHGAGCGRGRLYWRSHRRGPGRQTACCGGFPQGKIAAVVTSLELLARPQVCDPIRAARQRAHRDRAHLFSEPEVGPPLDMPLEHYARLTGAAASDPSPFLCDAPGVCDHPAGLGKVGRNGPCPCGSGEKYKHCHGPHR